MGIISSIGAFNSAREYYDQLKSDSWNGVDRIGNVGTGGGQGVKSIHQRHIAVLGGIELLQRFRASSYPHAAKIAVNAFAPIIQTTKLGKAAQIAIETAKIAGNSGIFGGDTPSVRSYADSDRFTLNPFATSNKTLKRKYGIGIFNEEQYGFFDAQGNFQNHTYEDLVNVSFTTDNDRTCVRGIISAFSDTVTPTWNETQYVGRPDAVMSYGGFAREVTFDLTLAAMSHNSLRPMYVQLNKIADLVLPKKDYQSIGARYSGNLVNITVGNYLSNELAACTGVTITPNEECPWEILDPDVDYPQTGFSKNATLRPSGGGVTDLANLTIGRASKKRLETEQNEKGAFKVPRVVTINLGFKVLHNDIPGSGNRPLIFTNTKYDQSRIQ
tara:strand:+ start:4548 stop:5702 length:1155 start_codon:yes stop_codon:yes gene_type:complete